MQVIKSRVETAYDKWNYFLYASDLHLGEVASSIKHIKEDFDEARRLGARIIMPGDVFGMILPKDTKRYQPSCVVPDLRDRDDLVNAYVEYASKVLAPYADLIDMVGLGNHELTIKDYYATDVVGLLLERLAEVCRKNGRPFTAKHGGITGFLRYQFVLGHGSTMVYVVQYHHGAGGDAPVTKGMIGGNRVKTQWVADAYVSGHTHSRLADADVIIGLTAGGKVYERETRFIKTGNYRLSYPEQNQKNAANVDYTEKMQSAVKPLGGTFVKVKVTRVGEDRERKLIQRVEV